MDNSHKPRVLRITATKKPLMPFVDLWNKSSDLLDRKIFICCPLKQAINCKARNSRLRNARCRNVAPCTPNIRTRKVSVIFFMKNDMWHHAIVPLMLHQCCNFPPRAGLVKMCLTKGCQTAIPIPLKWVKTMGRHGIAAQIILFQNIFSGLNK